MQPPHRMTRNSSNKGVMRATKFMIAFNLTVPSIMLGILVLSSLVKNEYLQFLTLNSVLKLALIVLGPGMIALGLRDLSRLRKSRDFYSMSSLPDAEREMRENIVARARAAENQRTDLEETWRDYRKRSHAPPAPATNPLKPRHRPITAGESPWSRMWRRDSYLTRGMADLQYSRLAGLATVFYVLLARMLIAAETSIWMLLYILVPLGIVVLWLWRFIVYQWIDLVRDARHRDRKLRWFRRENNVPVEADQPDSPTPHRHLTMDWETYRKQRAQRKRG